MQLSLSKVIGTAAALTIAFSSIFIYRQREQRLFEIDKDAYIARILPRIIARQEKEIGIKHFDTPRIRFEYLEHWRNGAYDPIMDAVTLSRSIPTAVRLEEVVAHELGHAFCDKLHEKMGFGDFVHPKNYDRDVEFAQALIAEGIAEYFEKTVAGHKDDLANTPWPDHNFIDDYNSSWKDPPQYIWGYHLVKPIIDKHGKRGISYLIINTPKPDDLRNLGAYQERALDVLSQ